jgi:spermidine synthase
MEKQVNNLMKKFSYCLIIFSIGFAVNAKQIDKERSIYRNVVITEEDSIRCMRFETRRKKVTNQACIDLENKQRMVFEYSHGLLAGYAITPNPKRILIIGLGGGVLSNVMHELSPNAEIINVDIDPVVVKLAKKYFDYKDGNNIKTVIKDGRVFVKRALLKKEKFDWIVLDAFNGDYIPEHLMTKEFLTETKKLLNDGGILTANTFSSSLLYDYESATYQNVFGKLQIFKAPTKGNRVIFVSNSKNLESFPKPNKNLEKTLSIYGVDINDVMQRINDDVDWDVDSRLLTEQYSPANLLKQSN